MDKYFKNITDITKPAQYLIVTEYKDINYTLIYRNTDFQPWIVAYGYIPEKHAWSSGHYFQNIEDATAFIQNAKHQVPYDRLKAAFEHFIEHSTELSPESTMEILETFFDPEEIEALGFNNIKEEIEYD